MRRWVLRGGGAWWLVGHADSLRRLSFSLVFERNCSYELPPPAKGEQKDVGAWERSVQNARAQFEHQKNRWAEGGVVEDGAGCGSGTGLPHEIQKPPGDGEHGGPRVAGLEVALSSFPIHISRCAAC